MLQGQKDLVTVGQLILSELAPVVGAHQAEFYVLNSAADTPNLKLLASYASGGQQSHGKEINLGEGLIGQCALEKEKILLTNVPSEAFRIASGLSETAALDVLVLPVIFEDKVRGVVELASLERFNPSHQAFLDQLTESIGIVINTNEANTRTENLLTQSQSLAEELQSRQQELQTTNEELQEKARLLAHQNQEVERKNTEVEQARQALEEKAEQLALTSKYKSEFLANMSHELRTPLNSLLILSDQLCKNVDGNLTPKQVEFSKTIHASGNDLLALINDILDLSKIESGTVAVDISELRPDDLHRYVERSFAHFADGKQVDFKVSLAPGLPKTVLTDIKRLQQIVKNLLSNAFKFTHFGQVSFNVAPAKDGWSPENEELNRSAQVIAFSVSDTGIGISADKQQIIFEAFQQADGSTSRKYGGTGLGLAISRELAKLLGGEIKLVSSPGHGSTFTLYLPQSYSSPRMSRTRWTNNAAPEARKDADKSKRDGDMQSTSQVPAHVDAVSSDNAIVYEFVNEADDDRDSISSEDKVFLIVENDLAFAKVLLDSARQQGFKGVVSTSGAAGLAMTREYLPAVITLDIYLPDMQGWRILDRLKADLTTRHIPVCVVSTDDSRERALNSGAIGFIAKPIKSRDVVDEAIGQLNSFVSRQRKTLLMLVPEGPARTELSKHLVVEEVDARMLSNVTFAREALRSERIDCLVIDESFKDFHPQDVLDALEGQALTRQLPVVLFCKTDGDFSAQWKRNDGAFALREAHSLDRLIDQTSFFLHRSTASMSEQERRAIESLHSSNALLAGKKALIVDDDMRNIFALATVLDEQGMQIVSANNGREAIRLVESDPDIDIVLMDIMMPEMDGITTMQEIRKLPGGKDLPMIAVTAKAMKGDRERCIEAGAWDYLSKPVDTIHLLAVLRGWLYR